MAETQTALVCETPPRARPLESVADLGAWDADLDMDVNLISGNRSNSSDAVARVEQRLSRCRSVPLRTRPHLSESQPKILVCHDMAGGYHDDALLQGATGRPKDARAASLRYSLQHWSLIDTFVYFSHTRFSIPPPSWTAASHRNGVRVFATFITEWGDGAIDTLRLIYGPTYSPDLPSTSYRFSTFYADRMVRLATQYGFDGWFINIEASLPNASHAPVMALFLRYLTRKMHEAFGDSITTSTTSPPRVIWYDSVTRFGRVQWQDELNTENTMFFNTCDGIFTNYTWREESPSVSVSHAGLIRSRDVYTGIDVWGRNSFGGGGFNTHKAIRVALRAGTSIAVFAPAWTIECLGHERFAGNERRFWCDVSVCAVDPPLVPACGRHGCDELVAPSTAIDPADVGCVADFVSARPVPLVVGHDGTTYFFYTDFDQGFGDLCFLEGKVVSREPWFNLTRQNVPPTHTTRDHRYIVSIQPGDDCNRRVTRGKRQHRDDTNDKDVRLWSHVVRDVGWTGGSSLALGIDIDTNGCIDTDMVVVFDVFDVVMGVCGETCVRVQWWMQGGDVELRMVVGGRCGGEDVWVVCADRVDVMRDGAAADEDVSHDGDGYVVVDRSGGGDTVSSGKWYMSEFNVVGAEWTKASDMLRDETNAQDGAGTRVPDADWSGAGVRLGFAIVPRRRLSGTNTIRICIGDVFVGVWDMVEVKERERDAAIVFEDWSDAGLTARWELDGDVRERVERREVWVDGVWRCAVYDDIVRIRVANSVSRFVSVVVRGYGRAGQLQFEARGSTSSSDFASFQRSPNE